MQIVVATHNEGKLVEIRRILEEDLGADAENIELVPAGSLHLPDPVETGVTFQEERATQGPRCGHPYRSARCRG